MSVQPGTGSHLPKVLIVDDELNNRKVLEIMLGPEDLIVFTAASGEAALQMIAEHSPDLVLMDVMMPGMDGYETTARIKANPAANNIPVIMVTSLDDREARIRGLSAGAEDFLSKPIDRAELCVRVRNLLRLKAYGDYHDKYGQMLEGEVGRRAAALVASEQLYRSTFDAAPVGIVQVGLDLGWIGVNQRLCDLLGYSHEELQSASVRALLDVSEDAAEREAFRQMEAGELDRFVVDEKQYRRKDGRVMYARVSTSLHRRSDGQPQQFIRVVEDITQQRALETQLRQANKMDAIGGLAAGIAHDFNNILSVIISYSEMLVEDLKQGDPMREDLTEIHRAGLRAVGLTRQLLTFSRQQVLQPQIVNLGEVLANMKQMLRRLIPEDIELQVAPNTDALGKVLVDPGQMEQVVMNLAINARDAMPKGGKLSIDASEALLDEAFVVQHPGVTPGRYVLLAVSDTGAGMDAATQARMFEPFFTTKEVGKGTGLGLATVFGIVRQSKGTIAVTSAVGKGTTFAIYFPIVDTTATPTRTARPERRTLRGAETILLVEDDKDVRWLARSILRKYGYNVLDAQSGGDAFLLCEQHSGTIHLLVTDVVMPRMSGRQLAARLLTIRPAMKVLYISGYMDDELKRHGVFEPGLAFLRKPFTPETLARGVREALAGVGGPSGTPRLESE